MSKATKRGVASVEDVPTRAVGPYLIQRTLGKGQTGKEEGRHSLFCSQTLCSVRNPFVYCANSLRMCVCVSLQGLCSWGANSLRMCVCVFFRACVAGVLRV